MGKATHVKKAFSLSRKKLICIAVSVFLMVLICVGMYFFYFKHVAISEPLTIRINHLLQHEQKEIGVKSVSPLGREFPFKYNETEKCWKFGNAHHKTISFVIPDSLTKKITSFEIIVGTKNYNIPFGDMTCLNVSKDKKAYDIPNYVRGGHSLIKKVLSVFYWDITKTILKILLPAILLFLVVLLRKRLKKIQWPLKSLLKRTFHFINTVDLGVKLKLSELKRKLQSKIYKPDKTVGSDNDIVKSNPASKKILIWVKIIFLSIVVAFSIYFAYVWFKFNASCIVTSFLLIILSGLFLWYVFKLIIKIFHISKRTSVIIKSAIIIVITGIFCFELGLRKKNSLIKYHEQIGFYYNSGFKYYQNDSGQDKNLLVYPKYYRKTTPYKEFDYTVVCNNEGLRDADHPVKKDTDEYRIICIGNSYTEGIGTPQDSTWPQLLSNRLKSRPGQKFRVINAGKASSDPFYEYMLLKERMLKYKPDLVLLTLGSTDFSFYWFRGGFERFRPDGVHYRTPPSWEFFYATSYIVRYFMDDVFKYRHFMSQGDYQKAYIKALKDFENCIDRFYQLSETENFKLAIVFYPDKDEAYSPVMNKLKQEKKIHIFDLKEYNKTVENITWENFSSYAWEIDDHFTPKGYDLMARGILWNLKGMGIIDSIDLK